MEGSSNYTNIVKSELTPISVYVFNYAFSKYIYEKVEKTCWKQKL